MGRAERASIDAELAFELRDLIVEAYGVGAEDVEHASTGGFRQVTDRGDVVREPRTLRPQHVESFEIELCLVSALFGHMASVAYGEHDRDEGVP